MPGKSQGQRSLAGYTEELYKKDLHDPDNHDGVITHLEPDILECEVKWALGSITTNNASGGDGIPVELFQILKDDAVKGAGTLGVPLGGTRRVGGLLGVAIAAGNAHFVNSWIPKDRHPSATAEGSSCGGILELRRGSQPSPWVGPGIHSIIFQDLK